MVLSLPARWGTRVESNLLLPVAEAEKVAVVVRGRQEILGQEDRRGGC